MVAPFWDKPILLLVTSSHPNIAWNPQSGCDEKPATRQPQHSEWRWIDFRAFSCTGQFLVSAMWFATFIGWFAKHIQTCWYLMCGCPENRGNWQTSINLRVAEFRVQHFDLSDKSADWLSALWHIMALFKTWSRMVLGTKTWSDVVQITLRWVHRI